MSRIPTLSSDSSALILSAFRKAPSSTRQKGISGTQADSINYNNEWVELYNNAAKKLMAEENIPVNDLYALCKEGEHYYKCPDMLHLTEEGYRKCAKQAADMILKELGEA